MVIPSKWVNDDMIKFTKVNKQPTREDKEDLEFCCYHRYVHHPTADRRLNFIALSRVAEGSQTPFPNHKKDKNKASVLVIIHENANDMELDESAIANSTLAPTFDRTLQRSPKFNVYGSNT
jgi:hypothetical protein